MAVVTRASTFAIFSNTQRNINNVQRSLFDAQDQLSSGLKTRSFSGLSGQVEQFVFLEARIAKVKTYQENNAVNISRLETTRQSLQQMIDIVDEMENLLTLRRNGAIGQNIQFEQQISSQMRSLSAELNTGFEGKFLFGGTRTNVAPVITDPAIPKPFESGVPDDGYYQGSREDVTLRADDEVQIAARVRADDIAFQKIFAAAFQGIEGDAANDDEVLVKSLDLLQSGLQDLIALDAQVSTDILTLEQISERQNSLQLYWTGVVEEVSKTDILSVSTKLSVDQTILQASFQAFAAVNQLRLSDFL